MSKHATPTRNSSIQSKNNTIWCRNKNRLSKKNCRCNRMCCWISDRRFLRQMLGETGKEWIGDVSRKKIATCWYYWKQIIRTAASLPTKTFAHCYQEAGLILIGLEEKVRYIMRSKENDDSYPVYDHHHSCHTGSCCGLCVMKHWIYLRVLASL